MEQEEDRGISIFEVVMLPDGFGVSTHPLLDTEEGEFVRHRLAEMLPELAKQLINPTSVESFEIDDGIVQGTIVMVNKNFKKN